MIFCRFGALRHRARSYASVSSKIPKPGKGPVLSLDAFIQRQRVISLWREIVRALYKVPPSPTRDELRQYARTEFERHKHVKDVAHIRYLLSNGKTEFDMMKRYVNEMAR
ncbi:complex 1 protein-domain-containing protein [Phyllosticta capitalensis]|uniref:LYR motif-containing protein 2 n=1 Tax=Phyllosticta capitalensis TaxID=121624 RepID=A0ABR1YT82_9PEZI